MIGEKVPKIRVKQCFFITEKAPRPNTWPELAPWKFQPGISNDHHAVYENLRLCGPFTVTINSPEIRSGVVSRQPANESQERPIRSVLFVTNGAGEVGRADNRADVESGGCAHNTRLQVPKKNLCFFF